MNIEELFHISGNFDIIKATDNIVFDSVLDIGFGKGGASLYFAGKNKKVTAIGKNIKNFGYPKEEFKKKNITVYESFIEEFEPKEKFDAIWASHILEHTANVSFTLQKMKNLLNDTGWLFICVPPNKNNIVPGHISVGWNLVQLMLVLYFNGFNVKQGHFASHKYNVCAFVKKIISPRFHPEDGGIVDFCSINTDFPIDLISNINGDIPSVNWFFDVEHQKLLIPIKFYTKALSRISELNKAMKP